jgi:hypothetical protein
MNGIHFGTIWLCDNVEINHVYTNTRKKFFAGFFANRHPEFALVDKIAVNAVIPGVYERFKKWTLPGSKKFLAGILRFLLESQLHNYMIKKLKI